MDTIPNDLRRSVETVARRMLDGIPGVRVQSVRDRESARVTSKLGRGRASRTLGGLDVVVFGWGPSLHGIDIAATVTDLQHPDRELARFAERQRRRVEAGRREGASLPFHRAADHEAGKVRKTEIGHMRASRSGLTILLEQQEGHHGYVAQALRESLEGVLAGRKDLYARWQDVSGMRFDLKYDVAGARVWHTDIDVPGLLPDTVMNGLPGLTVGHLAKVHAALDGRIIEKAEVSLDGEHTRLVLRPDNVRIGEIIQI